MRNKRHAVFAGATVAVIMLTAACGGEDSESQGTSKVKPAGVAAEKGGYSSGDYGAGDDASGDYGSGDYGSGDYGSGEEGADKDKGGSGGYGKGAGDDGAEAPAAPDQDAAGTPAGKQAAELSTTDDAELGSIIVNGEWMTLYRFDKDSAWPMKFGCLDACLDTWKPAEPVDKSKVKGVSAKLVGTVTRPDGSKQLTIDCWPVYTFTGDKKPGDTNGQAKQGVWWAVTENGKKAGTAGE